MRVLVFDTETTGLPKTKNINPETLNLWPHIVQFSYIVYDTELNDIIDSGDTIVKMNNINIPEDSVKFHGITNEISDKKGVDIELILIDFLYHLTKIDILVGHNIAFDINMIKVELLRIINKTTDENEVVVCKNNLDVITNFKNIYCTLYESIKLCDIKAVDKYGRTYVKFPKLVELHEKLFKTTPNHLHNSFNDILVTLRCFIKLKHDIDLNLTCDEFIKISYKLKLF
jgi:DNA polymerase III epsilon subunit-like protein